MKKIIILLCIVFMAFFSTSCSKQDSVKNEDTSLVVKSDEENNSEEKTELDDTTNTEHELEDAVIYIGSGEIFKEYSVKVKSSTDVRDLLDEMSKLTGWNLNTEFITSGKGGVSVSFATESFLTEGPPEEQVEEFHVYDFEDLILTVLDSVKKTIQMNFVTENGDSNAIDVYFMQGAEGEEVDLVFPDYGINISSIEPYNGIN